MTGGGHMLEGLFIVCALLWTCSAWFILPWPWNLASVALLWTYGAASVEQLTR